MSTKLLAKKIQIARKGMGLTQADLAYRMGVSEQLISAFENGRIQPERKYLEKIAQFTHQPLHFFTGQKILEVAARIDVVQKELTAIQELLTHIIESGEK